ncbi:MAG: hypothetical protein ACTSWZ_04185 [Candidatus Heimdallarchaeaceae archaeon]
MVQILIWDSKPRIVVTDAGVWYPVLRRLGTKSLLSKVVYAPILNFLMPPLRVIVGFILFSLHMLYPCRLWFYSSFWFSYSLYAPL